MFFEDSMQKTGQVYLNVDGGRVLGLQVDHVKSETLEMFIRPVDASKGIFVPRGQPMVSQVSQDAVSYRYLVKLTTGHLNSKLVITSFLEDPAEWWGFLRSRDE